MYKWLHIIREDIYMGYPRDDILTSFKYVYIALDFLSNVAVLSTKLADVVGSTKDLFM